jgi:hypothetical protein
VGADQAHERFSAAIGGADAFHPGGPRYTQEEALFAFVFNACSALECFYYAFYNACAGLAPGGFPTTSATDLRSVAVVKTVNLVQESFPNSKVATLLKEVSRAPELARLRSRRNALTHRGTSPRRHDLGTVRAGSTVSLGNARVVTTVSNPDAVPADWTSDLVLTPGVTAAPRSWIGRAINVLISGGADFLDEQLRARS